MVDNCLEMNLSNMKQKILLIIAVIAAIVSPCTSAAQKNLSREGTAHLRAAETLKTMATSTDDKAQVAEEYVKVTKSDPDYADAYLEAARIYSALTPELGKSAYQKAKSLFEQYADLRPKQASEIDADLIVLEAMLRKHANGPTRLDGIWSEWWRGYSKYVDMLEVSNNGSKVRLINPDAMFTTSGYGSIRDIDVNVNGSECSIIVKVFHDERPRLRKKGWSHYYDDCDSNADPGFPRSGRYNYNESLTTWYYSIDLSHTPLEMICEKIHTDYYMDGSHTYSKTDRKDMYHFHKKLEKK